MNQTIDHNWRPHAKTSSSLLNLDYSQEQLNKVGQSFLKEFGGQTIERASTKFYEMVCSSCSVHNFKDIKYQKEIEWRKKRKKDFENKVKGSVKSVSNMTDKEAIEWINRDTIKIKVKS